LAPKRELSASASLARSSYFRKLAIRNSSETISKSVAATSRRAAESDSKR
jgi:hypothetical protein